MDLQIVLNAMFGLISAVVGFLVRHIWDSVSELHKSDKQLVEKVNAIELLVAGEYVKRSEIEKMIDAFFKKYDKIENKIDHILERLDSKADKL